MATKLLTAAEAAERLAVSPVTVRRWLHRGHIPSVKLGRTLRVREEDVEALVRFGLEPTGRGTRR